MSQIASTKRRRRDDRHPRAFERDVRSTSQNDLETVRRSELTREASDRIADEGDTFLTAAIENRAKEIGIAVFDTARHALLLTQFIETSRTYTTTLTHFHRYPPRPLIIVDEKTKSRAGSLTHVTRSAFDQVPKPRGSFDDAEGEVLIEELAINGSDLWQTGSANTKRRHYLAIGAAGALLKHLQDDQHQVIQHNTLTVEFVGTEKHMQLDLMSIECLGITRPSRVMDKMRLPSLFKIMDRTKTSCGAQLLKANLLQPLIHVPTLKCRYEAVKELKGHVDLRTVCAEALESMPKDLDKICSVFTVHAMEAATMTEDATGKESTICRRISALIDGVMLVKDVLESLSQMAKALQNPKSVLLKCIVKTLGCPVFDEILERVHSVLDDQVHRRRAAALKRIEQCYAVKSGFDGFLDVARMNFCKITEQIHSLANNLQEEHRLPNIKVSFNSKRGFSFFITLPRGSVSSKSSIPEGWIVIEERGKNSVHCVTHELIALNSRLKDATHDCMLLTQQALESVAEKIVEHLSLVQKMVDSVALLDLLWSLAELAATSTEPYIQPCISQDGPLAISAGRHPIYETIEGVAFTPNDSFFSPFSCCHIITGPNMSGKSTYLKQVALLLIMAQVGSFVPADHFLFSPRDRIFSRMGFADSIETNSSGFVVEMQEMAYILEHVTERSLVIVDELGRATSTIDGESIAWAVSEKLLQSGCFSLIATHFSNLPYLPRLYPGIKLENFEVELKPDGMHFTWKLRFISCQAFQNAQPAHYGIELAKVLSFPADMIDRALEVSTSIHSQTAVQGSVQERCIPGLGSLPLDKIYSLCQKLLCLATTEPELEETSLMSEVIALKDLLGS